MTTPTVRFGADRASTRNVESTVPKILTVVLDSPPTTNYHVATVEALRHAVDQARADIEIQVVRTPSIDSAFLASPGDAVLIGPGSPYDEPFAAEEVIRTAREQGLPLVAT